MESKSSLNDAGRGPLNGSGKVLNSTRQMLLENCSVNRLESIGSREADRKDGKVPLESRVDRKAPRRRIHAGDVLDIVDFLECDLDSVVPMVVVHVLTNERVGLDCSVLVHLIGKT